MNKQIINIGFNLLLCNNCNNNKKTKFDAMYIFISSHDYKFIKMNFFHYKIYLFYFFDIY